MRRVLLVLALLWSPSVALTAEKKAVSVDKVSYKGWKNNLRVSNGTVELIATLEVGPRILSYRFVGGTNVLKEYTKQLGKSGEKEWQIRGGHRLWTAPEDLTRTYAPDNRAIRHEKTRDGGIRLVPPTDKPYGIQKEIDLKLSAKGTRVTLIHRLSNVGSKPTRVAPWALTVMAPGGVEFIPLPAKKPHPGSPKNARSPADFAPNQHLVLWPYFDFADPRWTFGSKYIILRQDSRRGPTKIGLAHRQEWVAYLNKGTLFVKRIPYKKGKTYPDRGCNFETFTGKGMLEVESLGPLVELAPRDKVEHVEVWELHKGVPACRSEADVDQHILPLVQRKQ